MKNHEHNVILFFITTLVSTGCLSPKTDSAADRTNRLEPPLTDLIPKFHTLSKIEYKIIRL